MVVTRSVYRLGLLGSLAGRGWVEHFFIILFSVRFSSLLFSSVAVCKGERIGSPTVLVLQSVLFMRHAFTLFGLSVIYKLILFKTLKSGSYTYRMIVHCLFNV